MITRNKSIILATLLFLSAVVTYFYLEGSFTGLFLGTTNPIRIGVILTTNDHYTTHVDERDMRNSIQLAVDNVNVNGINGTTVVISYENDQNDVNTARAAMENLIGSGAKIILVISWEAFLELASSARDDIILFLPTSSRYVYNTGDNTFRNRDFIVGQTLTMADVAYEKLGLSEVLILYSDYSDDRRGTLMKDLFKWRFEDLGGVATSEISFNTSDNFNEQMSEIKNIQPENILITGIGRATMEIISIIKKIREQDINSTILLPIDISKRSAELNTENIIFVASEAPIGGKYYEFLSTYTSKYGEPLREWSLNDIHDSINILAQAMEICNGDDTECIKNELRTGKFKTANGEARFDENGILIKPYLIRAIENGEAVDLYTYSLVDSDISKYSGLLRNVKDVYGQLVS